jgi:hypothetical protein
MTDLEKAARQALELCGRIVDGKAVWSLSEMIEVATSLRAALEKQAEPVSAPPKSFRVGYMTGYDDGRRELREKQQAEPVRALQRYTEIAEEEPSIDMGSALERLRFFCSLSMSGQDWLDVEPFFDAVKKEQAEPVALNYARRLAQSIWTKHYNIVEEWKPLDDLIGVLTQIDHMTSGLTRQQAEPVTTEKSMNIELTEEDLVLLSDALQAQIHAFGAEAAQTEHEEDQGALIRHAQALEGLKDKLDDTLAGTYAVISRVKILF